MTVAECHRAILAAISLALGAGGLFSPATAQPVAEEGVLHPNSVEGLQVASWVTASQDNRDMPFIVIDKDEAEVLLFDGRGLLQGVTPALLGIAHGDDATPGIGDKELNEIGPAEKTTPAGRYLARIGPAKGKKEVLWVDFKTSVALHPVITTNPKEHRLARLQSPTPMDNRITFGCINVPAAFFKELVLPSFSEAGGIVYILPEKKFLIEVFPAFWQFVPQEPPSVAEVSQGG
jgi:hypothetical protein